MSGKAEAKFEGYEVVSKLNKENITLYAKEVNGLYQDFKIDFKGQLYSRPFWMSVAHNPNFAPEIYFEDINQDEKEELIIVLNKGYGTGVLQEEVYVHGYKNGLVDVLVDNPLAIINKNVKTKLSTEKAKVSVGEKVYTVDITPLQIESTNIFGDIVFGDIINYEATDNQLIVRVSGRISPASNVGDIVIIYEYRDRMYQAKSIDFQPIKL
jgi:hypothetical protein